MGNSDWEHTGAIEQDRLLRLLNWRACDPAEAELVENCFHTGRARAWFFTNRLRNALYRKAAIIEVLAQTHPELMGVVLTRFVIKKTADGNEPVSADSILLVTRVVDVLINRPMQTAQALKLAADVKEHIPNGKIAWDGHISGSFRVLDVELFNSLEQQIPAGGLVKLLDGFPIEGPEKELFFDRLKKGYLSPGSATPGVYRITDRTVSALYVNFGKHFPSIPLPAEDTLFPIKRLAGHRQGQVSKALSRPAGNRLP